MVALVIAHFLKADGIIRQKYSYHFGSYKLYIKQESLRFCIFDIDIVLEMGFFHQT